MRLSLDFEFSNLKFSPAAAAVWQKTFENISRTNRKVSNLCLSDQVASSSISKTGNLEFQAVSLSPGCFFLNLDIWKWHCSCLFGAAKCCAHLKSFPYNERNYSESSSSFQSTDVANVTNALLMQECFIQQFEICICALRFKSGNLKRDYLFVVLFVVYNISARLHPVYQISE